MHETPKDVAKAKFDILGKIQLGCVVIILRFEPKYVIIYLGTSGNVFDYSGLDENDWI